MTIYHTRLNNHSSNFIAFLSEEDEHVANIAQMFHDINLEFSEIELVDIEYLEETYLKLTNQLMSTVYYNRENLVVFFSNTQAGLEHETSIDVLAAKLLEGRLNGIERFNYW